jgi:hypothetical protein
MPLNLSQAASGSSHQIAWSRRSTCASPRTRARSTPESYPSRDEPLNWRCLRTAMPRVRRTLRRVRRGNGRCASKRARWAMTTLEVSARWSWEAAGAGRQQHVYRIIVR